MIAATADSLPHAQGPFGALRMRVLIEDFKDNHFFSGFSISH